MSFWDTIQDTFTFSDSPDTGNVGTAMDNSYNNNLNFDMNTAQPPVPQWQANAANPIQNPDPQLNQGMNQASGNIAISDSYGGFGNDDNTGYAGSDGSWKSGFGEALEAAGKAAQNASKKKGGAIASGGGFSGGGGSFRPVEIPKADLSYLQPYTSPFTSGFKV